MGTLDDMAYGGGAAPAAPMDISPAAQNAQDPQAGAGWKQKVNGIAGAVGNALGNFQITNGQVGQRGAPGPGGSGAAPLTPNSPISDPNNIKARADGLLQRGLITPEIHQRLLQSMGGQQAPGMLPAVQPPSPAWGQ